ncbi:MAG: cellulase family glycosylhydrolase, partial [Oscillospiraceae bacterium]|nr:cellulase family glycosylhydrolase [Oscillospiraceae bacterium]
MLKTQVYGRISFTVPAGAARAEVALPGGGAEGVPVFARQPVAFAYDYHGYETVNPDGAPVREARYTAHAAGAYEFRAYDAGGGEVACIPFEAEDAGLPGYVVVSDIDPRYFALSCGGGYLPIGLNLVGCGYDRLPAGMDHFKASQRTATTGLIQWRRWFAELKAAGANYCRIWLSNHYTQARTEIMGVHDLIALERFDAVMALARAAGVRVKLCFEHWRTFSDSGHFAFKRYVNPDTGLQLTDENEWFQSEKWNERWLQDVAPYIDRYHDDPVVFAWELWNEIDCGNGSFEAVAAFTKKMLPRVKALSPHNLTVNSLGSFDEEWKQERQDAFRDMPEMEFQQVHRYLDQGAPMDICHSDPVAFSIEAVERSRRMDKPCILTETGGVNDRHVGPFRFYQCDHKGRIFYDVTYPALFAGAAGSGHIWHWGEYVEAKNLFKDFAPLADAFEGIAAHKEGFEAS